VDKLNWGCLIIGIAAVAVAIAIVLLYRRKTRRIMENISAMLESAVNGDFSESVFDESTLSAVETQMARFLSACAASSKNLTAEKDKIKSLISDISHQTKTPIANILLYAQLLNEYELPPDCAVCVKALAAQAEKLNFLIGALVKISRLETGIIAVNTQREPVDKLLSAAISQIKTGAQAKNIVIAAEASGSTAFWDPKWTTEAIYNILDNAVKYSPAGSTIKVKACPHEMFCRIDITDTGIGIAEAEQSQIFLRFFRSPAVSGQEGVGIGLFLAREIISSGGGYIKVSSRLGQGSTFSIYLPMEKR